MQLSSNLTNNPFLYGANSRFSPYSNYRSAENPFSQYAASPYSTTNYLNNQRFSPFRTNGQNPYSKLTFGSLPNTGKRVSAEAPTNGSLQESADLFMSTMAVIMLQSYTNKTGKYTPELDQMIGESLGVDLYGDELPNSASSRAKKGLTTLPGGDLTKVFGAFSATA